MEVLTAFGISYSQEMKMVAFWDAASKAMVKKVLKLLMDSQLALFLTMPTESTTSWSLKTHSTFSKMVKLDF